MVKHEVRGIETGPRGHLDIEMAAQSARRQLAPDLNAKVAAVDLFEFGLQGLHLPVGTRFLAVDYAVDDIPIEGRTEWKHADGKFIVTLDTATHADLAAEVARARFCLAHELGHLMLHRAELIRLAYLPHEAEAALNRTPRQHKVYCDTEWQANAFAGAFLMPTAGIQTLSRAKAGPFGSLPLELRVALHFGVSQEAATYRIKGLRERGQLRD